jgi:drug/metabolite transporter (DMT)-like permease
MAAFAALGQAAGAVLARVGLGQAPETSWLGAFAGAGGTAPSNVSALAATGVRMLAGAAMMCVWAFASGRSRDFSESWRERRGVMLLAAGTVFGPYIGVWLSLVAFAHTEAAVAQTLIALQPVLILPVAHLWLRERVTPRAVLGALVAVAGVAVLAFRAELDVLLRERLHL